MALTRRAWLAGAGAAAAAQAPARPTLCLFSKHLPKLHYSELGPVIKQLGFDGCDLTVRPGGHVQPELAGADMIRAIEALRGEGVEVPMLTTALLSAAEPTARPVVALAGRMKVPFFKPGYWRYGPNEDIETRLAQTQREIAGLALLGRTYGMTCGVHNHSGNYVGAAVWDIRAMIAELDPQWVGYYFDPCHATIEGGLAGWNLALRMVLPRLKMVAVKDFYWTKDKSGKWRVQNCPLGQGMVDWPQFFALLAKARFAGPISMHVEYDPPDELSAIARDFEFLKKLVAAAYGESA